MPLVYTIAAVLGMGFALGCGDFGSLSHRHPSDAELLALFAQHRPELEQLVRMFKKDEGLGRVGADFTRPENADQVGVSPEREAEYRRLCAALGAPACIEGYVAVDDAGTGDVESRRAAEKDPIWIHVSSSGLAISGSGKGFLYSANPTFEVVDDLDHLAPRSSGTWLRPIEGPWYLYFDYED